MTEIAKQSKELRQVMAAGYSEEEIGVIKNNVAKGTTLTELAYFLHVSKNYGLDPLKKEIWAYKDTKGNLIMFAGRDGHLAAAQRDKRWTGIASSEVREKDTFEVDIPNGEIKHTFGFGDRGNIVGAYAKCKPKGCDIATIEVVDFKVYNKGYNTWKSDPAAMIKKVAETHCLKKAYGLSGLASEFDFEVDQETQKVYTIDHEDKPTMMQLESVQSMINNSTLEEDRKCELDKRLKNATFDELSEIRGEVENNQLDPIHEKGNYSQTNLKNHE